jgi:hypothetical protein
MVPAAFRGQEKGQNILFLRLKDLEIVCGSKYPAHEALWWMIRWVTVGRQGEYR